MFPDRVTMNCKHLQTKFTDISNSKLFNFFLDEVLELPGLYCLKKNSFGGQLFCIHEYTLYHFLYLAGLPKAPVFQSGQLSKMSNSHVLTWLTESYSRIIEYRLVYRKVIVSLCDFMHSDIWLTTLFTGAHWKWCSVCLDSSQLDGGW